MQQEPRREHHWLQQLVGSWRFEAEALMGPDQPPVKLSGTETVRSLGGLWVVCESTGDTGQNIMTLGYDVRKQRYVGSFVGSMMDFLWIYDGMVDAAGRMLALDTMGPTFTGEKQLVKYQDRIEVLGPDHRTLSSGSVQDDGSWSRFMVAHYHRE